MKLPARFGIIKPLFNRTIGKRTHRVPYLQALSYLLQPSMVRRGKQWVTRIDSHPTDCDKYQIWIKGIDRPFAFPRRADLNGLYGTIDEACRPKHWHQYQVEETKIRSSDVVIDCGAGEGLFALQASLICKHVYAIEPLSDFVDCLSDTFRTSPNVTVLNVCASDSDGMAELFIEGFKSSQEKRERQNSHTVQQRSLDSLFGICDTPITYIKADIEGFELEMLKGAKHIISAMKPRIAATMYHGRNDVNTIERYLLSLRADYSFLRKGLTSTGKPVMLHAW